MKRVDCTSVITYDVTSTSYQARHEESLTTPGAIKLTLIGARSTANARVTPSRAPALPAVKVQFLRGLASTEPTSVGQLIVRLQWRKEIRTSSKRDRSSRSDLSRLGSLKCSPVPKIHRIYFDRTE